MEEPSDKSFEYLEYLEQRAQKFRERLLGVILGFKTRTILKKNRTVHKYRAEYQDLLGFAFKLQMELSQLNEKKKTQQA